VQQSQLNAAIAQLSSSWARQTHELTSQLSCLTSRLELLEGAAARQEQVVMQVGAELQHMIKHVMQRQCLLIHGCDVLRTLGLHCS
jgi:hypothetical protein